MLGNSIEIKYERTKESLEKIGLMKELGNSMLLEPGRKVGYVKHEPGKKYEVGDIIVYTLESGVNVYHVVVSYEDKGNTRVYRTQGINNKYADLDRVYEHQLIGQVVKFSESELAFLIEMAEQGRIPYIEGLGMTNQIQKIQEFVVELKDKLTYAFDRKQNSFFEKMSDSFTRGDSLDVMFDIMNKIRNMDDNLISGFDGNREDLRYVKINLLKDCKNFVRDALLSGYSYKIFVQAFNYIYGDLLNLRVSFNELNTAYSILRQDLITNILGEAVKSAVYYYSPQKFYNQLEEKGFFFDRKAINDLISEVFRIGSYRELAKKVVDEDVTYGNIRYDPNKKLKETECNIVIGDEIDIEDEDTYIPNQVYLVFGKHDWKDGKRIGYGIKHIFAGHW
ncbi:MAG: hypothetical protein P8Y97_16880, partial [Candidatus Lokiarchaeota archaeon]